VALAASRAGALAAPMPTSVRTHVPTPAGDRLDGRVALVTGATGELGRSVARALAARGATLGLHHHESARAAGELAEELRAGGATASVHRGEVRDGGDVRRVVDELVAAHGTFDVLVHTPGRVLKKPLADVGDEEYDDMFAINARSTFLVLREVARRMADGGRVVLLTTSLTGVTTPLYSVYAGAKAPVEQFAKVVAHEVGARGITVNAVGPGPINSSFFAGQESDESAAFLSRLSVAGRLGEWAEVVPLVAFLCTPDAGWITGQTIRPNGGMVAG